MEKKVSRPLVSVVVPCFNQAQWLSETLDSVLRSTYADWECIVVDDGSTDSSRQIAQRYAAGDSRFKLIEQKNSGVSIARNNGIAASLGKFILPLDADDIIAPTYIEKAVKVFETDPEVKLVCCNAKKFGAVNERWILPDYSYEKLLFQNLFFVSAVFKRKDFNRTSGYNPNMIKGLEDWDFWLDFLKPCDRVFCINEVLFFYRIRTVSRSTDANKNVDLLKKQIYRNHKNLYEPYLENIISWCNAHFELDGIRNSYSYRIGHAVLAPVRLLKKLASQLIFRL